MSLAYPLSPISLIMGGLGGSLEEIGGRKWGRVGWDMDGYWCDLEEYGWIWRGLGGIYSAGYGVMWSGSVRDMSDVWEDVADMGRLGEMGVV